MEPMILIVHEQPYLPCKGHRTMDSYEPYYLKSACQMEHLLSNGKEQLPPKYNHYHFGSCQASFL